MSATIRSLVVKVGADLSDFQKKMKDISRDIGKVGKDFKTVGDTMTKGVTLPILGATAALTGMAVSAGKNADELITLSNKTGIAVEDLQELQYAARFIDVEVETMTSSMQKLTKNMDMARRGSKEQEAAFSKLGVEFKDQNGELRNAKDVWADVLDALGAMSNEAERDATAMSLFGKSAAELNPLIKAGGEELNRYRQEAQDMGAVLSEDTVNSLGAFDDSMEKLKATAGTAVAKIGAAFLPILEKLMPILQDDIVPLIGKFADFVGKVVDKFNALSPETQNFILAALGIAVALGPVISLVGKMISGVGSVTKMLGLVASPAGIVIAIILALAAAAYLIIKNWDKLVAFFKGLWEDIKNVFAAVGQWFGKIFDEGWAAVKKAFSAVGKFFGGIWDTIKGVFKDIGTAIGDAIGGAFKKVVNAIIDFAENTINGFIRAINAAIKLINKIPGVNIKLINELDIPSLDVGTNYVPQDMIAKLHKGEAVIPAKYVDGELTRGSGGHNQIEITANYNVTSKELAEYANNDLLRKLQGRGVAVAYR